LTSRSRIVLAVHWVLLRTSRRPVARLWALGYRAFARLAAAYFVRGEDDPAIYLRGSFGTDDFLPGVSDIDLAIALAQDPAGQGVARERVGRRRQRFRRALPIAGPVLGHPLIYEGTDLADLGGASALTYALDNHFEFRAGYTGGGASPDRNTMLERPGLYGAMADWSLLSGPDRRPRELAADAQLRRIAAWLELVNWWGWAFPICIDPSGPRTAALCAKLIAEPARIWLWLAHGERISGRADALDCALRRMPEEEEALRLGLALERSLPDSPEPPLDQIFPVLVRFSARIAALIGRQIEGEGATEVCLVGARRPELIRAHGGWRAIDSLPGGTDPPQLPLCDWRSLVIPGLPDPTFALLPSDPSDPAVLAAVALSRQPGPQPALQADGVMIFPAATRSRSRLRAVQCAASDPVSFALAGGERVARFPNVRGWSADDTASRAVAEHWARLDADRWASPMPDGGGDALAHLLTAARAALFLETVRDGEPQLAVTVTETARQLAARSPSGRGVAEDGLERYRDFAVYRTPPPPATVSAMRKLVLELPAYSTRLRSPPPSS
jgi:hypothetical protein